MNRETAVARWYRRIDPRCFTFQRSSYTGDEVRRLIDPEKDDRADREATVLAAATVPGARLPLGDRPGGGARAGRLAAPGRRSAAPDPRRHRRPPPDAGGPLPGRHQPGRDA